MHPGRRINIKRVLIVVTLVMAWTAYLARFGPRVGPDGHSPPSLEPPPRSAPTLAEYDWKPRSLDGSPVDFGKFRGKPIVLNIWATWCEPCLDEMPSLANLAANPRVKARGIEVVCVSVDALPDAPLRFSAGKAWPMTMLHSTLLPPVFIPDGFPTTFLIAPDGKIASIQGGAAKWDDPAVVEFLLKLAGP